MSFNRQRMQLFNTSKLGRSCFYFRLHGWRNLSSLHCFFLIFCVFRIFPQIEWMTHAGLCSSEGTDALRDCKETNEQWPWHWPRVTRGPGSGQGQLRGQRRSAGILVTVANIPTWRCTCEECKELAIDSYFLWAKNYQDEPDEFFSFHLVASQKVCNNKKRFLLQKTLGCTLQQLMSASNRVFVLVNFATLQELQKNNSGP